MRRHLTPIKGIQTARGYAYACHYQLVWVTKYRHVLFQSAAMRITMQQILEQIAQDQAITIQQLTIDVDQIRLLVSCKPKVAPTTLVKMFKGFSARDFLKQYPNLKTDPFWAGQLWSNHYLMGTIGSMTTKMMDQYVQNQYQK